jgi:hypothetical protein
VVVGEATATGPSVLTFDLPAVTSAELVIDSDKMGLIPQGSLGPEQVFLVTDVRRV